MTTSSGCGVCGSTGPCSTLDPGRRYFDARRPGRAATPEPPQEAPA